MRGFLPGLPSLRLCRRKETIHMVLYHTGYQEIRDPDVHYGRKNADFGQGFYLTDDREFACRWAKERKGSDTIVNTYDLSLTGLKVHRFARDADWFAYIFRSRRGQEDSLPEADVILGPIANDTIYDTLGIMTSGLLSKEEALKLLLVGPEYRQIALKTEKAAAQLTWISAEIFDIGAIRAYRRTVEEEQAAYQRQLAEALER